VSIEKEERGFHERLHAMYQKNGDSNGNTYISDGIINYDAWQNSPNKILFVLKEPNTGGPDGEWSLSRVYEEITFGQREHSSPTIFQLAKLARILNTPVAQIDGTALETIDYSFLRGCSAINIKKNYGRREAEWSQIDSFAKKYASQLKDQIEFIKPRVMYCGGYNEGQQLSIRAMVVELLGLGVPKEIKKYGKIMHVHVYEKFLILDAYHPQYQKAQTETREACAMFVKDFAN